jgi:transcriptional regulator with XRE-family HTH domain
MRNIEDVTSGDWASFVREGRREVKMTQEKFAAAARVNRSTVYRWEKDGMKPESVSQVIAVADVLGVDHAVALKAAGLAPPEPAEPRKPHPLVVKYGLSSSDSIVRRILAEDTDEVTREQMFRHYRRRLDEAAADIDWMARTAKGTDRGMDSAA